MAETTTEERLAHLEGRFDTLLETLSDQLGTMNERISDMGRHIEGLRASMNTGFIVLATLMAAQLAATITIAVIALR